MSGLITPDEAAEVLQLSRRWVIEAAARGELPGLKLGRWWRFDREDLDDWINRQRSEAREAAGL
jgi:excisionase family DNA binding protein